MTPEIVISKYTGTIVRVSEPKDKYSFSGTVIGIDKTKEYQYRSIYKIGEYSDGWEPSSFEPYAPFNNTIKII